MALNLLFHFDIMMNQELHEGNKKFTIKLRYQYYRFYTSATYMHVDVFVHTWSDAVDADALLNHVLPRDLAFCTYMTILL